jgi:hypothetical protein
MLNRRGNLLRRYVSLSQGSSSPKAVAAWLSVADLAMTRPAELQTLQPLVVAPDYFCLALEEDLALAEDHASAMVFSRRIPTYSIVDRPTREGRASESGLHIALRLDPSNIMRSCE